MIQINATLHTKSGLTIDTGVLLDVTPHFLTPKKVYIDGVFDKLVYSMSFDVAVYKNMSVYKEEGSVPVINTSLTEFNIGFTKDDIDVLTLASIDQIQQILLTHIEEGDLSYPGVGTGNAVIIYPTSDIV